MHSNSRRRNGMNSLSDLCKSKLNSLPELCKSKLNSLLDLCKSKLNSLLDLCKSKPSSLPDLCKSKLNSLPDLCKSKLNSLSDLSYSPSTKVWSFLMFISISPLHIPLQRFVSISPRMGSISSCMLPSTRKYRTVISFTLRGKIPQKVTKQPRFPSLR